MQRRTRSAIIAMSLGAGVALSSGQAKAFYQQTNLVSDLPGVAEFQDPNLVNPWGMSFGPKTAIWVSDNGMDIATIYKANGVAVPVVVSIPSGAPDGQVFNPNPGDFRGAEFIFASENGGVDAWSGGSAAVNRVGTSTSAVYKGITIGTSSQGATLYVANFRAGTIDVFNSTFKNVSLAGSFTDPGGLPAGYAPFNVENIGGKLYVTYAVQDPAKHDDVAGLGNGIVDVFDTNGNFLQRLVSNGALDSPWGLALAPSNFGKFSGDLLVGNFGNGMINAFNPTSGAFLGSLTDASGNPIVIQGLWGLMFGGGTAATGATNELFFAAGIPLPGQTAPLENHGLFGTLTVPEPSTLALLASGAVLLSLRRRRRT